MTNTYLCGIINIVFNVTVNVVEEVPINVKTSITYEFNYSFNTLKSQTEEVVENHLSELYKTWRNNEYLIVRSSLM